MGDHLVGADLRARHRHDVGQAVIAIPDPQWGEVGLAYVVPVPGARVSPDEVIAHVRSRLARYKTPKRVVVSDTLPRTASGKLQKNLIRERALKEFS